jgi:hypothetical protein
VIDPKVFPDCSPVCAGAHCLPSSLVPSGEQKLLNACTGGFCTPDPLISTAGNYIPKTCTSVAGSEGRCLSSCLPLIAQQGSLIPQDICAADERCAPCYNPTAADPTQQTGACMVGCDMPKQPPTILTCPYSGPDVVDPNSFPPCSPACGGAHCLPASLVPASQQALLAACPGGFCAPDPIIASDNHYVPPTCTSIAGAEGRCLSTCLPMIAAQADLLPQSTCATGTKCAPCYNPTAADPTMQTQACSLACDKPTQPPVILMCPWTGPAVLDPMQLPDCSPACTGAHCLPSQFVPTADQALLAGCTGGFCTPDPLISTANNFVPPTCTSIAGAEGRCLSDCLPLISQLGSLLPQSTCGANEHCAPCYNPTATDPTAPTQACSLGCDKPAKPPVILTCPWTGPAVIDPSVLPACSPACTGAHCLPSQYVPTADQAMLATCTGGFCTPDPMIQTAGDYVPPTCTAFAGTASEGRCLSTCLPQVQTQAAQLHQHSCAAGDLCAPCYDPFSGADTKACRSSTCDAPANPAYTFPTCCPFNGADQGTCVPTENLSSSQQGNLSQLTCPTGLLCVPDEFLPTGSGGQGCSASIILPYSGTCISNCAKLGVGGVFPQGNCPDNHKCIPCNFAPAGSKGC